MQSFCSSQPCLNSGLCVEVVGGYLCDCTMGYAGYNCEWDAVIIESHGNCSTAGCRAAASFSLASHLHVSNTPGAVVSKKEEHLYSKREIVYQKRGIVY